MANFRIFLGGWRLGGKDLVMGIAESELFISRLFNCPRMFIIQTLTCCCDNGMVGLKINVQSLSDMVLILMTMPL